MIWRFLIKMFLFKSITHFTDCVFLYPLCMENTQFLMEFNAVRVNVIHPNREVGSYFDTDTWLPPTWNWHQKVLQSWWVFLIFSSTEQICLRGIWGAGKCEECLAPPCESFPSTPSSSLQPKGYLGCRRLQIRYESYPIDTCQMDILVTLAWLVVILTTNY